ncbi:hypothetical protein BU26DRAFT_520267 [Trematosphaeria pertusa]|uniref:Core Histone H2A/H2B/H3 domain-containing protein n=1 Tax=Trematosphaeria pertusa TaxID=390896 RepID=A0A6A6IDF4_9PLEO|nr:uncharacterized protein BU26DRAFT_520267 [Trematosphaeria pertusa]KAF2248604.1 hypothetical protein BU26DRAFT_520267 [Trematosphaeria pertusa]
MSELIWTQLSDQRARFRWQLPALDAVQEAAEAFLVFFFAEANIVIHHAGRETLTKKDSVCTKGPGLPPDFKRTSSKSQSKKSY